MHRPADVRLEDRPIDVIDPRSHAKTRRWVRLFPRAAALGAAQGRQDGILAALALIWYYEGPAGGRGLLLRA
jgi:hypothetical protein